MIQRKFVARNHNQCRLLLQKVFCQRKGEMMKSFCMVVFLFLTGIFAVSAQPTVDGKISDGEYQSSVSVLGGKVVVSYQSDADGGLFIGVKGKTNGWTAVGLGSQKMDGAIIFIGYVGADGKAVFSEETGKGHGHSKNQTAVSDQSFVAKDGEWTVLEFHIPHSAVPIAAEKGIPFIAAYSDSKDLKAWHGLFNHASGFLPLIH
jgi:hypothetical protein